jgi:hypothetical protein
VETQTKTTKSGKPAKSEEKRIVTGIHRTVREDMEINSLSGIYFIRTSLAESEKILRQSYNTICEIEYANRVLKTDLDLRPVFHKKNETSMAHLHSGLLAYRVVNTVRFQLKKKGTVEKKEEVEPVTFQWKETVRIMNTQKVDHFGTE